MAVSDVSADFRGVDVVRAFFLIVRPMELPLELSCFACGVDDRCRARACVGSGAAAAAALDDVGGLILGANNVLKSAACAFSSASCMIVADGWAVLHSSQ